MMTEPIIRSKHYAILDRVCFILLCVLLADCCIFGGGRLISVGPIGFRMAVFALLLLASVPLLYQNRHKLLKNRYLWCVVAFGIWIAVSGAVGIIKNNSTEVLLSDIKGYCYFAILPTVLCVLNSKSRVQVLMKVMAMCSGLFALAHIAVLILYWIDKDSYDRLYWFCLMHRVGALGIITNSVPRMFFNSVVYLLCGCGFSLYFYVYKNKNILYAGVAGVSMFAVLLSYTRSIYGGFFISAACCVLACIIKSTRQDRKRLTVFVATSVFIFSMFTAGVSAYKKIDFFSVAVARTMVNQVIPPAQGGTTTDPTKPTEPDQEPEKEQIQEYLQITQQSDDIREKTLAEMIEYIRTSAVFGHGLGTTIKFREETDGGLSEYFYLDLWEKSGIVGLALYVLPLGYGFFVWKRWRNHKVCWTWICILFGIMAASFFNPYMNASLGILFYCCTLAVLSLSEHTNENPCKTTITQEETK